MPTVRLDKRKRPGGVHRFQLRPVRQDRDGVWLAGPIGSPWTAPHDTGTLPVPVVVLLAPDRPWAAWWVGDPHDPRLEIDVCLPPAPHHAGWRYTDLELDPVRHERDDRVEIEDWDEYEEAVHHGWMTGTDAALARRTAEDRADALRRGDEPWQQDGWRLLAQL